jgi:hypothetical protein
MLAKSEHTKPVVVFGAVLMLFSALVSGIGVRASNDIDMVLLIAVDVSASVDNDEYRFMREGLARALSSDQVADAISGGAAGAIAINIMQWSGFTEQEVKIDWLRVSNKADLLNLARNVRRMKRRYDGGATDIGGALDFAIDIIASAPFQAAKRVIDIAGDGTNNVNYTPNLERDRAVAMGMTVNALAVTGGRRSLVEYYSKFVIGGDGAFVESTDAYLDFETAMRRKLAREIGSLLVF